MRWSWKVKMETKTKRKKLYVFQRTRDVRIMMAKLEMQKKHGKRNMHAIPAVVDANWANLVKQSGNADVQNLPAVQVTTISENDLI